MVNIEQFNMAAKNYGLERYFCPSDDCSLVEISVSDFGSGDILAQFHVENVYRLLSEVSSQSSLTVNFLETNFNNGFFNLNPSEAIPYAVNAILYNMTWNFYCGPGIELIPLSQFVWLCGTCLAGQYSNSSSKGICTPCPLGEYAPTHQSAACFQCPEGYTTKVEGATTPLQCEETTTTISPNTTAILNTMSSGFVLVPFSPSTKTDENEPRSSTTQTSQSSTSAPISVTIIIIVAISILGVIVLTVVVAVCVLKIVKARSLRTETSSQNQPPSYQESLADIQPPRPDSVYATINDSYVDYEQISIEPNTNKGSLEFKNRTNINTRYVSDTLKSNAPVQDAPVENNDQPVHYSDGYLSFNTAHRFNSSDAPGQPTDAPVNSSEGYISIWTAHSGNSKDAPVNSSDAPVNLSDAPVNSSDAPVNGSDATTNSSGVRVTPVRAT